MKCVYCNHELQAIAVDSSFAIEVNDPANPLPCSSSRYPTQRAYPILCDYCTRFSILVPGSNKLHKIKDDDLRSLKTSWAYQTIYDPVIKSVVLDRWVASGFIN